ncbi:MAG: DJ-1/PfpI family protein [Pelagimonas sp.]
MQIAIVLYPGLTALDALGPYELLKYLPGAEIRFVWHDVGPVPNDRGVLLIGATHTLFETAHPDVVIVPGSEANTAVTAADKRLTGWLRRVHETTRITASVCSGAVVLGAAGLLKDVPATSHWAAMTALPRFGALPRPSQRLVKSGRIWTAAGVSAGLDMALELISELAGERAAQEAQLLIEYDPRPAFDAGHMDKAPREVRDAVWRRMAALSRNPRTAVAAGKLVWQAMLRKARRRSRRSA